MTLFLLVRERHFAKHQNTHTLFFFITCSHVPIGSLKDENSLRSVFAKLMNYLSNKNIKGSKQTTAKAVTSCKTALMASSLNPTFFTCVQTGRPKQTGIASFLLKHANLKIIKIQSFISARNWFSSNNCCSFSAAEIVMHHLVLKQCRAVPLATKKWDLGPISPSRSIF